MPCHHRCSHPECITEHDIARTECVLGCGDEIGYDADCGFPADEDGPAHLTCMALLDEAAATEVAVR